MALKQKDYELVATILLYLPNYTSIKVSDQEVMALQFAKVFSTRDTKFNRSKFLKACGLED